MSRIMLGIALGLWGFALWSVAPMPASAAAGFEIVRNGDFSSGCEYWEFSDISFPEFEGCHPSVTLNCTGGFADAHHVDSYALGTLSQRLGELFSVTELSFNYWVWGLDTGCSAIRASVYHGEEEVIQVLCYPGDYFSVGRYEVYVLGEQIISLDDPMPHTAGIRVVFEPVTPERTDIIAFLRSPVGGRPAARAEYAGDPGIFAGDRLEVFTSTSCHWSDSHICYDNVSVKGERPERGTSGRGVLAASPSPEAGPSTWGSIKSLYR